MIAPTCTNVTAPIASAMVFCAFLLFLYKIRRTK